MSSFQSASSSPPTSTVYPLVLFKDYMFLKKNGDVMLIDTGSMLSIFPPSVPQIEICGRTFPNLTLTLTASQVDKMLVPVEKLRELVGCEKLDGLLGLDVLSKFNLQFDFANNTVLFSSKKIDLIDASGSGKGEESSISSGGGTAASAATTSAVRSPVTLIPIVLSNNFAVFPFYYLKTPEDAAEKEQKKLPDMKIKELIDLIDLLKLDRKGLSERSELVKVLEENNYVGAIITNKRSFQKGLAIFDTGAPKALWLKDRSHEKFPVHSTVQEFKIGYNNNQHFETVLYSRPCQLSLEPSQDKSKDVDVNFWTFKMDESTSTELPICPHAGCQGATLELLTSNPYSDLPNSNSGDEVHCDICVGRSVVDSAINCKEGFYHCNLCGSYDQCSKHDTVDNDYRLEMSEQLKRILGRSIDAIVGMTVMSSRLFTLNWNSDVGSKHMSSSI